MAEPVEPPGYDVAIVGLGPVGAIFANLLSNYGLKIAVVANVRVGLVHPRFGQAEGRLAVEAIVVQLVEHVAAVLIDGLPARIV